MRDWQKFLELCYDLKWCTYGCWEHFLLFCTLVGLVVFVGLFCYCCFYGDQQGFRWLKWNAMPPHELKNSRKVRVHHLNREKKVVSSWITMYSIRVYWKSKWKQYSLNYIQVDFILYKMWIVILIWMKLRPNQYHRHVNVLTLFTEVRKLP